jgi:hypothetical protein
VTATVTVRLADGTTATVPEPAWCAGQHEDGLDLVDLMHDSHETHATVRGRLGSWRLLSAAISWSPFASRPEERLPRLTVDVGGEVESFDPVQVEGFADVLVDYAQVLRELGVRVRGLREGGGS